MCQRATCASCGRPTFMGCGNHVEQVLADVAREDRCTCREAKVEGAKPDAKGGEGSWLRNFFPR